MKIRYTWWLHNNAEFSEFMEEMEQQGVVFPSEEDARKAYGIFYEVELDCELDVGTGQTAIVRAR